MPQQTVHKPVAKKVAIPTRRRIQRTSTAPKEDVNVMGQVARAFANYLTAQAQIEVATRRQNEEQAKLEKLMTDAGIAEHEKDGWIAHWTRSRGKIMKSIEVDDLRKALGPKRQEEFDKCVKVQITPTKQFLTESEIAAISKETGGELGDPQFSIEPKKAPK